MSTKKIMGPDEIRLELARRRMTRRELADRLNLSHDYMIRIVLGLRDAEARRAQITEYFKNHKSA